MRSDERYFGGFRLREMTGGLSELPSLHADVSIFVVNWESRSKDLLAGGRLSGEICILVQFEDWPGGENYVAELQKLAGQRFANVEVERLASPLNFEQVMSDAEGLARKISKLNPLSCAVDYTSMPKSVVQTLFRQFMVEGLCPIMTWLYLPGRYDDTPVGQDEFHQGATRFFGIRGAEGSGGMSTQRVGIIALGADRPLTDAYLRQASYDEVYFLCATSDKSPEMTRKMQAHKLWLMAEHGAAEESFISCNNLTVIEALKAFDNLLKEAPADMGYSVDLFCSGPKSHGLAASALVTNNEHVRLVARQPSGYARFDVISNGEISVTTVSDFTNPAMARALVREAKEKSAVRS